MSSAQTYDISGAKVSVEDERLDNDAAGCFHKVRSVSDS